MPLTRGKGQVQTQSGNFSRALICEQIVTRSGRVEGSYASPVIVGGGTYDNPTAPTDTPDVDTGASTATNGRFYRYQPRLNAADLATAGTTIPTNFFDGSAAQTPDAPGLADIANGLTLALSANGTALFFRQLTQDPAPTHRPYGGSVGDSLPAAVTVMSSQSLDAAYDSATQTIADGTPSTTSPVQLNITPASATIAAGQQGKVRLEGTDWEDTVISEEVTFANASTAGMSCLWYKTITGIYSSGWSAGTYTITAQDLSQEVIFTPRDDLLRVFWTIELLKGTVPNIYTGLAMQNATIDITDESLIAFACTFLGRQGFPYTNISGQKLDTANPDTRGANITNTGANRIVPASAQVFADWQTRFTAETSGLDIALTGGTFTLNQELEYTNVKGSRFQGSAPGRGTKRLVQMEATVLYDLFNNYSTYFESNQTIPNANLSWTQSGYGVYPGSVTIEMPECQLTADPDPAIADEGTITQPITMKAVRGDKTGNAYEYRIRCRYSDYPVLPALHAA